jgi:hypothetical protein
LDFTKENGDLLLKMLKANHPEHIIMNDWKSTILEKLTDNLHKEGFTDEQVRRVARSVWAAFDL